MRCPSVKSCARSIHRVKDSYVPPGVHEENLSWWCRHKAAYWHMLAVRPPTTKVLDFFNSPCSFLGCLSPCMDDQPCKGCKCTDGFVREVVGGPCIAMDICEESNFLIKVYSSNLTKSNCFLCRVEQWYKTAGIDNKMPKVGKRTVS